MKKQIYALSHLERMLNFPYRLNAIGWMPDHTYIHNQNRIRRIFVCLSFNCRGKTVTEVDGERVHSSGKDHLSILWPGTLLQTIRSGVHDEIFFEYDAGYTDAFRRLELKSLDSIRFTASVETIINDIRHELDSLYRPGTADRLDQLAIRLFTELTIEQESVSEERHTTNLKIHDIASYFASHFQEKIVLDDLLRRYGFSRRTFYREWNRLYKTSPVHFLLEQRMKLAAELLSRSNGSLTEIAAHCGFSDLVYFHQRFRMYFGCSPLCYRRQNKNGFSL